MQRGHGPDQLCREASTDVRAAPRPDLARHRPPDGPALSILEQLEGDADDLRVLAEGERMGCQRKVIGQAAQDAELAGHVVRALTGGAVGRPPEHGGNAVDRHQVIEVGEATGELACGRALVEAPPPRRQPARDPGPVLGDHVTGLAEHPGAAALARPGPDRLKHPRRGNRRRRRRGRPDRATPHSAAPSGGCPTAEGCP